MNVFFLPLDSGFNRLLRLAEIRVWITFIHIMNRACHILILVLKHISSIIRKSTQCTHIYAYFTNLRFYFICNTMSNVQKCLPWWGCFTLRVRQFSHILWVKSYIVHSDILNPFWNLSKELKGCFQSYNSFTLLSTTLQTFACKVKEIRGWITDDLSTVCHSHSRPD